MHGRRRVWLKRLGGVEIALAGMLRGGGVTSVSLLDAGADVAAGDLVLDPGQMGHLGPGLRRSRRCSWRTAGDAGRIP
jgi:hypothetical protein